MICACHGHTKKVEIAPTTIADRPSHIMKAPGASVSSRNSSAARMNQFQAPSETIQVNHVVVMAASSALRAGGRNGRTARRGQTSAAAGRVAAERLPRDLGDAGERTEHAHRLHRQDENLLVWRIGELAE